MNRVSKEKEEMRPPIHFGIPFFVFCFSLIFFLILISRVGDQDNDLYIQKRRWYALIPGWMWHLQRNKTMRNNCNFRWNAVQFRRNWSCLAFIKSSLNIKSLWGVTQDGQNPGISFKFKGVELKPLGFRFHWKDDRWAGKLIFYSESAFNYIFYRRLDFIKYQSTILSSTQKGIEKEKRRGKWIYWNLTDTMKRVGHLPQTYYEETTTTTWWIVKTSLADVSLFFFFFLALSIRLCSPGHFLQRLLCRKEIDI